MGYDAFTFKGTKKEVLEELETCDQWKHHQVEVVHAVPVFRKQCYDEDSDPDGDVSDDLHVVLGYASDVETLDAENLGLANSYVKQLVAGGPQAGNEVRASEPKYQDNTVELFYMEYGHEDCAISKIPIDADEYE